MVVPATPPALYAKALRRKVKLRAMPDECSGSGHAQKCSGSGYVPEGCPLPPLADVQYEANRSGGWEVWHAPQGREAHRQTKTYLGYASKRLLAQWAALPESERLAVVAAWVADRRAGKGIR